MYVGCTLSDGSYVSGLLRSWSKLADDTPDRDLVINGDIFFRPGGAEEGVVLPDVGGAVLSARNIQLLTVSYLSADAPTIPPETRAALPGSDTTEPPLVAAKPPAKRPARRGRGAG